MLVAVGVQAFTIGLLGELILFFHGRNIRDYHVAAVHEADVPLRLGELLCSSW